MRPRRPRCSLAAEPLAVLGHGHELDWRTEGIADGAAEQTAAKTVKGAQPSTDNWTAGSATQQLGYPAWEIRARSLVVLVFAERHDAVVHRPMSPLLACITSPV